MRARRFPVIVLCAVVLNCGAALVAPGCGVQAWTITLRAWQDFGRQTLAPNDGWAAATTGTTGGAAAVSDDVFSVTNRQQLVAALGIGDPAPRIIPVQGHIDANVDDANRSLGCDDYVTGGYSIPAYLAAYDPATWGKNMRPSGSMEDARRASQQKQGARVQIKVGPNTTIVAPFWPTIVGGNLVIEQVDNVIVRNITFLNAHDCFPQWDPTDGNLGNWNSNYDNISLNGATHVWVDHCLFSDGDMPDSMEPSYFGRPYQVHDGEVDITKGSNYVTVSWNRFTDHDKTMLIGSTDNPTTDVGKLRVTLHHNLFAAVLQRAPRVRFGQVHVYNNLYELPDAALYQYRWGVGVQPHTYVENNAFRVSAGITPQRFINVYSSTAIHVTGTLVNGQPVDVLDLAT